MPQPASGMVADLARSDAIRPTLDWFRKERAWINEQHLKLCRIPAPTFFEQKRAEWIADRFRSLGWEARIDRAGNVVAGLEVRRGEGASQAHPPVAVTAHLDTVLSPRAPEDIKISGDGRMLGPGVSDNGAGLAGLLALAACWNALTPLGSRLAPVLIANVGEEGEGNLCGMRYLCRTANTTRPRSFLVLDGPGTERITSRALACRRFDITVAGPGGHSWSDHGVANPVHALSRAITLFNDRVAAASGPRCSFNFGLIQGGASINAIPTEARAKLDLRSESRERMEEMAALLASTVEEAQNVENARAMGGRMTARVREIGSRPGGALPEGSAILECLQAVDEHLGIRAGLDCSSTDANIPLSMGLPALSVGAGGQGGGAHTPSEWYQPDGRELGLRRILLTLCLLLDSPGS